MWLSGVMVRTEEDGSLIDVAGPSPPRARFAAAKDQLAALDAETAGALVSAAADVSLILDANGIILDAVIADADLGKTIYRDWVGRRWVDTVTPESRPKIDDLVREANERQPTRWRQVNHPAPEGPDAPVRYCAMRFGPERRIIAVGRDLRALGQLQQRLAEAQQGMEREYARIRNAEKRYRLLFQLSVEAVVIVDAVSQRVVEINPAAAALFGAEARRAPGAPFVEQFDVASRQAIHSLIAAARVAPRIDNVYAELATTRTRVLLSGSLYRQDTSSHLLVLLSRAEPGAGHRGEQEENLLRVVGAMPEALVVIDSSRRVLSANPAFLDLAQLGGEAHARGELIERWIGRPGVDVDVLFANLKTHGVVRHFSTVARGELGSSEDVEIAGVATSDGGEPCFGLTIRAIGWRAGRERLGGRELPRTVEHFTELVGRVPLKNLVRETTDLIERLCIEAALELTGDNRAAAAEMLGLSRQGFYAKLRRYGLGNLGDGAGDPD
jgi:transcriptional regulator PpsR